MATSCSYWLLAQLAREPVVLSADQSAQNGAPSAPGECLHHRQQNQALKPQRPTVSITAVITVQKRFKAPLTRTLTLGTMKTQQAQTEEA